MSFTLSGFTFARISGPKVEGEQIRKLLTYLKWIFFFFILGPSVDSPLFFSLRFTMLVKDSRLAWSRFREYARVTVSD